MKIFPCVLAVVALFAFGNSAVTDSSASCPNNIDLDDSAWVLRAITKGEGTDAGEYAYTVWKGYLRISRTRRNVSGRNFSLSVLQKRIHS